uniref:Uncharacterized protein n=1 Tax=Rhizophora mucronata TaxID=61149 RepID=A0A2P2NZM2_RHIMU
MKVSYLMISLQFVKAKTTNVEDSFRITKTQNR